ncbi:MAG: polysaccharide biosynthesis tyrosine autokinase [Gemmatimonadetes bacterium]|nr:polysaccharide biosynthesis tyrosine autokinase [Gemmatimonadota bacterium]
MQHKLSSPHERAATPDHGNGNLWVETWPVLRRRKLLILGCGIVALVAAQLSTGRGTPEYQAVASIRVDERQSQPPLQDVVRLSSGNSRSAVANNISTEMQMLQTRSLARSVVDSLGLRTRVRAPAGVARSSIFSEIAVSPEGERGEYAIERTARGTVELLDRTSGASLGRIGPDGRIEAPGASMRLASTAAQHPRIEFDIVSSDAAARALSGAVEVTRQSRDTEIIEVRYRGTDPELVRDVTNALVTQFIEERNQSSSHSTLSTVGFIRAQISGIETRLAAAEEALRAYRESAGVVSVQDQATTEVRQTADLVAQHNVIEAERVALARVLNYAEVNRSSNTDNTTSSSYRDLVAFPSLLRNQAVSSLLSSLNQVEDRRADLLARRSPSDHDVMILTRRAEEIEQQLHTVAVGYLQGLNSQAAALDGVLASSNRKLGQIPEKEMRFAQLQREVTGLEQVYEQLQARLKEAEIAGAAEDVSVRLVDAAMLPTRSLPTKRNLLLALSLVVGLAGGVGLAFVRELKDGSVRTRGDAQFAVGVPVLGMIPRFGHPRRRFYQSVRTLLHPRTKGLGSGQSSDSTAIIPAATGEAAERAYAADAYERLHTNLLYAHVRNGCRVVVFTSALPGDGKSTSAANFALALATRGLRVVLIDADLRRGSLSTVFRVPRAPGLTELVSDEKRSSESTRTVYAAGSGQLDLVPTGELPAHPTQVLDSPEMSALVETLRARYDLVVVDTPPLNVVSDATVFNTAADAVVMVARAGVTPVEALIYAGEVARNAGMPLVGTLLNGIDFERDASYDPAYRWYSYGKAYYTEVGS